MEGQMNLDQGGDSETWFAGYVAGLGSVSGHADRTGPLRDYCTGLMLPGERKSVEPMAARTAAQHQSLLHFVGVASWSDEKVLAKVRQMVLPATKGRPDRSLDHRRHLPSRASIRSACTTNIAGRLASRPTAR
jgi:SRSO17 transposase